MAFDDIFVWIIIGSIVLFLFGASKIPGFARALGQARREFDLGSKGVSTSSITTESVDPLFSAAEREGIDTAGKTREQIASELSWKLNKK
jgi:TatA/E family protein of Tat protein translocase